MERATKLWRARNSDRLLEGVRAVIVLFCALALITAGRALPF